MDSLAIVELIIMWEVFEVNKIKSEYGLLIGVVAWPSQSVRGLLAPIFYSHS